MRLFVATRLGEAEASRIHSGFAAVRSRAPRASWARPHAFHLTYAFVGEQGEEVATRIGKGLAAAVRGLPPYVGAVHGGGFFPDDQRPRVGWLGFESPAALLAVADGVRRMLDDQGVPFDSKAFQPHLTVARIREPWSAEHVAQFKRACDALGRIEVVLDRVSLFRSDPGPDGMKHIEVAWAVLTRPHS